MQETKNSKLTTKNYQQVEVIGFDYYDPKQGDVISGGAGDIAMWMLDVDYDGWSKLAKNLKAELDEEKLESFRGTVSLQFVPGKAIAVKIVDARGIESLKIFR
ncbi:MAG: hypothetical protein ACRCUY_05890 [Thermoguttaceae bacterium]